MRCRTVRRSLLAAWDGELAAAEREALDAHLSACEACRALAGETARLHQALAAMPQEAEVSARLAQATLRRVRAERAEDAPARGAWWWMAAPLAATLVGVVVWHLAPSMTRPPEPVTKVAGHGAGANAPAATERLASRPDAEAPREGGNVVEPPPQVAQALDLYLDMPILENMEKLQNYDSIRTVDVGDGAAGEDGRG